MHPLLDSFKKTGVLHHAHLILGDPLKNREALEALFIELLGRTQGHPDLWELTIEQIGIDESRALRDEQSRQPFEATRRIFVVQTFGITEPAQHALLKTLEDPNPSSHFFFLMPGVDDLLPTLRSRFMVLHGTKGEEADEEFARTFLKKYPADRMKLLEKFGLADIDPEKKKEVKRFLEAFLGSLEPLLQAKLRGKEAQEAHKALEELFLVKKYMGDSGATLRFLMDHLVLVLPVFLE